MNWDTDNPTGPVTYERPPAGRDDPGSWYDRHLGWVALGGAVFVLACIDLLGGGG